MALPWGGLLCPHILGTSPMPSFFPHSYAVVPLVSLLLSPTPSTAIYSGRLGLSRLTPVLLVSRALPDAF